MKIYVGTFSKELNSTKRPSLSTSIDVELKDGCSFLTPVLIFNESVWSESYNYCYIPKWNRYYYLHDAVVQGPRWFVTCAVDVLASWRTEILASSAYVTRSASDYSVDLPDASWSHPSTPSITKTTVTVDGMSATGCFLLFTASDDTVQVNSSIPSLAVYLLTGAELKQICNYMFSSSFFDDASTDPDTQLQLDSTTATLAKTFFNPFQYIIKCMWLPINPTYIPHTQGLYPIGFGWWNYSSLTVPMINDNYCALTFNFTQGSYNDWTDRSADWTNTLLYVPGFGQFNLSPEFQGLAVSARIVVDLATGNAQMMLDVDNKTIQSATGKLGCDIQLSSLYEDVMSDITSKSGLLKTAGGAAAGAAKTLGGALRSIGHNVKELFTGGSDYQNVDLSVNAGELVSNAAQGAQAALQPTMTLAGTNSAIALIAQNPDVLLTVTHFARFSNTWSALGGTCNRVKTLGNLSGYTEVVNPNVQAGATSSELAQISNFLRGGFYIE